MGEGTPGAAPDWVWRQYQHICVHFVAAAADGATGAGCRAGASLAAATDAAGHLACFAGPGAPLGCGVTCPLAAYPTEAQALAASAATAARMHADLADIRAGRCPYHRHPVRLRQVGRSVDAAPCGCCRYQGPLPRDDPPPLTPRRPRTRAAARGAQRPGRRPRAARPGSSPGCSPAWRRSGAAGEARSRRPGGRRSSPCPSRSGAAGALGAAIAAALPEPPVRAGQRVRSGVPTRGHACAGATRRMERDGQRRLPAVAGRFPCRPRA